MIHYHGTPISGGSDEAWNFLAGRHALIPFARPDNLDAAAKHCVSFVLDNSAFSLWRKGGDVDVAGYHQWVHSVADCPSLAWCLIPDKIDAPEQENIDLVTLWLRMGSRVHSVPVWHLHESMGWLDYLVSNFQTVALGSSGQWRTPGTTAWWDRMTVAMETACDSDGRPRARLHGLRMLDPEIFTRLPLHSADSTNAAINAGSLGRFGAYTPPEPWQRATVIAWGIEKHQSPEAWCGRGPQTTFALEANHG